MPGARRLGVGRLSAADRGRILRLDHEGARNRRGRVHRLPRGPAAGRSGARGTRHRQSQPVLRRPAASVRDRVLKATVTARAGSPALCEPPLDPADPVHVVGADRQHQLRHPDLLVLRDRVDQLLGGPGSSASARLGRGRLQQVQLVARHDPRRVVPAPVLSPHLPQLSDPSRCPGPGSRPAGSPRPHHGYRSCTIVIAA